MKAIRRSTNVSPVMRVSEAILTKQSIPTDPFKDHSVSPSRVRELSSTTFVLLMIGSHRV